MSKSKNTIDPEKIISDFGADSVGFYFVNSPPEKDVQWSDEELFLHLNFYKNYGT